MQYLGSFPVQAADQGDRAEFVRKQLVSMKVINNRYDLIYIIEWLYQKSYYCENDYMYFLSGGDSKTASSHGDLTSWDKSYLSTGSGKICN